MCFHGFHKSCHYFLTKTPIFEDESCQHQDDGYEFDKSLIISIETAHIFEDQSFQHTDDSCEFHKRLFLSKSETPNFPNRAWLKKWSAQYILYQKTTAFGSARGGPRERPEDDPKPEGPQTRDPKYRQTSVGQKRVCPISTLFRFMGILQTQDGIHILK